MKMMFFLCLMVYCLVLLVVELFDGDNKKVEAINELNEQYEYRFCIAVTSISPRSTRFVQETFMRYRPEDKFSSYFDNLDAVALLELVEEEAIQKGRHKHIATFIRSCVAY